MPYSRKAIANRENSKQRAKPITNASSFSYLLHPAPPPSTMDAAPVASATGPVDISSPNLISELPLSKALTTGHETLTKCANQITGNVAVFSPLSYLPKSTVPRHKGKFTKKAKITTLSASDASIIQACSTSDSPVYLMPKKRKIPCVNVNTIAVVKSARLCAQQKSPIKSFDVAEPEFDRGLIGINLNYVPSDTLLLPFGLEYNEWSYVDNLTVTLQTSFTRNPVAQCSYTGNNLLNINRKYVDATDLCCAYARLTHTFAIQFSQIQFVQPSFTEIFIDNENCNTLAYPMRTLHPENAQYYIIPICYLQHWIMYLIQVSTKTIFYLDSLQHENISITNKINRFCAKFLRIHSLTFRKHIVRSTPRMRDGESCGVYITAYIEQFFYCLKNNLPLCFDFDDSDIKSIRCNYARLIYEGHYVPLRLSHNTRFSNFTTKVQQPGQLRVTTATGNVNDNVVKQPVVVSSSKSIVSYIAPPKKLCPFTEPGRTIEGFLYSEMNYDENDKEKFNRDIHAKILSNLNTSLKACKTCGKGFLNVQFHGIECMHCFNYKIFNKSKNNSNCSKENDMDPGPCPPELSGLTLYEQRIIAPIHASLLVIKLKHGMFASAGHTIFFNYNVNKVVKQLPNADCNIVMIGRNRGDGKILEMKVRRNRVKKAIEFLIANNVYYREAVTIDEKALKAIPDEGYGNPTQFIEEKECAVPEGESDVVGNGQSTNSAVVSEFVQIADEVGKDVTLKKLTLFSFNCPSLEPVNEFRTPGLLNLAFPHLLMYGTCELFLGEGQKRPKGKVNMRDYAYHLMSHKEDRFRKDLVFKFVLTNICYRNDLLASARLALSKPGKCLNMNIEDIRKELQKENSLLKRNLDFFKKTISGSETFWLFERNKLEQACKQTGFPALFATFSCADHHWHDLRILYNAHKDDVLKDLVNQDPFPCVVYFCEKVKVFLNDFFPKVYGATHYSGRFEFQNRGAVHFHCLIFIEEYAKLHDLDVNGKKSHPQVLIDFIDRMVSAVNPYFQCNITQADKNKINKFINNIHPDEDNTTHAAAQLCSLNANEINDVIDHGAKLCNAVLRHTVCGAHCQRVKNGKTICRYRFPREIREKTIMLPDDHACMRIHLKRNDPRLSSHIKFHLGSFNSNCAVEPIDSVSRLFEYLLKYVTKSEKKSEKAERIVRLLNDDTVVSKGQFIRKYFMIDGRKEVSAHEAAMYLLKQSLVLSSFSYVLVNTSDSAELTKDGFQNSSMTQYSQRSDKLWQISMFEFFKKYSIARNGRYVERKSEARTIIVPIPYHKPLTEAYYERECILHFPWSTTNQLTKNGFETWEAKFKSLKVYPYRLSSDYDKLEVEQFDRDDFAAFVKAADPLLSSNQIDEFLDVVQHDYATYEQLMRAEGQFAVNEHFDWQLSSRTFDQKIVADTLKHIKTLSDDDVVTDFPHFNANDLNIQQRQVYEYVRSHADNTNSTKFPLRLIVSGAPGCGKSFCIRALQCLLKERQAACAFTGTAASLLINGSTIHSMLGLNISKKNSQMSSKTQERLRKKLGKVEYLIIDEFSMLSLDFFGQMSERLKQIFPDQNTEIFAGLSVILFGDLHQLGPVSGVPLYSKSYKNHHYSTFGAAAYFTFKDKAVLTISVRHQTDPEFFDILNRVKVGKSTKSDHAKLMEWEYNVSDVEFNDDAVHLFYTNRLCKQYNYKKLEKLQSETNPVALITAEGKYRKQKKKDTGAGTVKQRVLIACGCRVMLRINLSLQHKLTNGSIGTVRNILYYENRQPPSMPNYVLVEFDNYSGPTIPGTKLVPIEPVSHEGDKQGVQLMKNIPLSLAYARTIHKCQGATISKVVLHLGTSENTLGLSYVGMSRTRRLSHMRFSFFPLQRLKSIATHQYLQQRIDEEESFKRLNIIE